MRRTSNQQREAGFHIIELAVALVVVLGVAGGGYAVWHRSHKAGTAKLASQSVPAAPQVKTASDLDKASTTVDQLDTSASNTDFNSLQNDLNSL